MPAVTDVAFLMGTTLWNDTDGTGIMYHYLQTKIARLSSGLVKQACPDLLACPDALTMASLCGIPGHRTGGSMPCTARKHVESNNI